MKTINPILNTFITGDCEQVLKEIPSDSIDFVLTSPPYADKRDYGNENSSISPDEYVEWFLPKGREIYRVLKPTGSFILNISDKVVDGFQHLYVFELLLRLCKEVGFHLVRDYIWYNPATPPNVYSRGGYGRTKKSHEYCFWFSKGSDWTFELDPIRKPYSKDMQKYLDGKGKGARSENVRPSTHNFNCEKVWTNNGGSDPGTVIEISQLKFLYPLKTLVFPAFSPPRFCPFPSFFPLREEMRETFFRLSLQPYPAALRKFAWPLWWRGRKCSSWYLHQNVPAAPAHPWVLPREREGWSYMYASTDGSENHPYPRSSFGSIGTHC